jgi:hypothetical protein
MPTPSFTSWLKSLFWLTFALIGLWAALDAGIGWDEQYELNVYLLNSNAVKGLLHGDMSNYNILLNHQDRYYGIGFHVLTHAFAFLASYISINPDLFTIIGKQLLIKHIPIFFTFLLSGVLVNRILFSITNNRLISFLGLIAFLLWPYLLGHGLMNIKDMPFLFAWLLCTYQALLIFEHNLVVADPKNFRKNIFILALCSGWLLTIRISGILIFIEYAVFGLLAFIHLGHKKSFQYFSIRALWTISLIFLLPFFSIVFLLYPIFWHNPIEFLNAIFYQSHNPIQMDTLTGGVIISNRDFLLKYILIWLAVKLPLAILLGLALTPLLLYKLIKAADRQLHIRLEIVLGLFLTAVIILIFLIINRVHLYNELRHVLFIFPLLFIVAISSLYFTSKKLSAALLVMSSIVFVVDDVKLHPYQYTYLNEAIRFFPVSQQFEKDYFALSAGKSAAWLNDQSNAKADCIYASPIHVWLFQIDRAKFPCNQGYPGHDLNNEKIPFLLYGQVRKQDGFIPLPTCQVLHAETRQLFFSDYKLQMSHLFACEPTKK